MTRIYRRFNEHDWLEDEVASSNLVCFSFLPVHRPISFSPLTKNYRIEPIITDFSFPKRKWVAFSRSHFIKTVWNIYLSFSTFPISKALWFDALLTSVGLLKMAQLTQRFPKNEISFPLFLRERSLAILVSDIHIIEYCQQLHTINLYHPCSRLQRRIFTFLWDFEKTVVFCWDIPTPPYFVVVFFRILHSLNFSPPNFLLAIWTMSQWRHLKIATTLACALDAVLNFCTILPTVYVLCESM